MRVVIAGGSGFLGRALAAHLAGAGDEVCVLGRSAQPPEPSGRVRHVVWHPDGTAGTWASEIDAADAVVNLAGAGIADRRWSAARKKELVASRLDSTASLIAALRQVQPRPRVFVQNCAVGYYGSTRGEELVDEHTGPGDDFLARLCVQWEAAAAPATDFGCRLVWLRTGVVLAAGGGALPKMLLPFRFFAGGPLGSGRQYLAWIHLQDWVDMMSWVIRTAAVSGAVNATAPAPVTNATFSRAIGSVLHRPSLLPAPAFALRLIVGELADAALLGGQRAVPRRAQELGFHFSHPDVREALTSLLER